MRPSHGLLLVVLLLLAFTGRYTFLQSLNEGRVLAGCQLLREANDSLIQSARDHSRDMAEAGHIFHSTLRIGRWLKVGEIVGVGSGVISIFNAFMASVEHREIILDCAYDRVAIGIYGSNGSVWITGRFYDARSLIYVRRQP